MTSAANSRFGVRASAEFAVIVIGVLVAFAVEDWANDRADRRTEVQYLTALAADLRGDSVVLADVHIPNMTRSRSLLESIAPVARNDSPLPYDTVTFLRNVIASYRTPFLMPGPTYEELLATGSLRLVESNELRSAIVSYYQLKAVAATRDETAASGYRELVRSNLPDSGVGANRLDDQTWEVTLRGFGVERASAAVRTPEFAAAVNRHLNYWVIMAPTLGDLLQRAGELAFMLDAEVERLN
jgi:hypothetical protein